MKRVISIIFLISFFMLSLSGFAYAVPVFIENFDSLGGWEDKDDYGFGISEIAPAGWLHQEYFGDIRQDIGSLSGPFAVETYVKFEVVPGLLNYRLCFGTSDEDIKIHFASDGMKVWDGTSNQIAISEEWEVGIEYKIRFVVNSSHTLMDTYLNDCLRKTDVGCSGGDLSLSDGDVKILANPNVSEDSEWRIDYIRVESVPEPGTSVLLITGLFGIFWIKKAV